MDNKQKDVETIIRGAVQALGADVEKMLESPAVLLVGVLAGRNPKDMIADIQLNLGTYLIGRKIVEIDDPAERSKVLDEAVENLYKNVAINRPTKEGVAS